MAVVRLVSGSASDESRSWLAFPVSLLFLLPYQVTCCLRADGVERRARVNSVAISVAAAATIFLRNPIEHGFIAGAVGLGSGLLALAFIFLRGRSLQTQTTSGVPK